MSLRCCAWFLRHRRGMSYCDDGSVVSFVLFCHFLKIERAGANENSSGNFLERCDSLRVRLCSLRQRCLLLRTLSSTNLQRSLSIGTRREFNTFHLRIPHRPFRTTTVSPLLRTRPDVWRLSTTGVTVGWLSTTLMLVCRSFLKLDPPTLVLSARLSTSTKHPSLSHTTRRACLDGGATH